MQWCDSPLFHPETDRECQSGAGALAAISARTAADRLYLIFTFMDIYQDLSASNPRIC